MAAIRMGQGSAFLFMRRAFLVQLHEVEAGPIPTELLRLEGTAGLLAGSLLQAGDFDRGRFRLPVPEPDAMVSYRRGKLRYRTQRLDYFQPWTLEAVVDALKAATRAEWVRRSRTRPG